MCQFLTIHVVTIRTVPMYELLQYAKWFSIRIMVADSWKIVFLVRVQRFPRKKYQRCIQPVISLDHDTFAKISEICGHNHKFILLPRYLCSRSLITSFFDLI